MSYIASVRAREVWDSRGYPTVEADVELGDGTMGSAIVPSGASTGTNEAVELRDNGSEYDGRGVSLAVSYINGEIREELLGHSAIDQQGIDDLLIKIDGTPNKARLGANAILAVSLANAKAAANCGYMELHEWVAELSGNSGLTLPLPMMNIINGGRHASGSTDFQEFMVMPVGATDFRGCVRMGAQIFHKLRKVLEDKGYATTVGDEGGYAPAVKEGNGEALKLIASAVEGAGYVLGEDVLLALDVASSELVEGDKYELKTEGNSLTSEELIDYYKALARRFPIASIEDGIAEDDWANWQALTARLGSQMQIVGDDLFATNTSLIEKGIELSAANAVLIKPNQIGTLTETIDAVKLAQSAGWRTIMSHRSGETEDTTIADLAVGLGTGQIKTGSLSRSERMAKYNRLAGIEERLGRSAVFAGRSAIARN